MAGDQELRLAAGGEIVNHLQERELSLGRERGLGLVEDVDAAVESIREEGQERLAVGLLV